MLLSVVAVLLPLGGAAATHELIISHVSCNVLLLALSRLACGRLPGAAAAASDAGGADAADAGAVAATRRGLPSSTLSSQTWRCSRVISRTSAIFGEGRNT